MSERGGVTEWVPGRPAVELGRVDAESEVLVLGQTISKCLAPQHRACAPR